MAGPYATGTGLSLTHPAAEKAPTIPEKLAHDGGYVLARKVLLAMMVIGFLRFDLSGWGPELTADSGFGLLWDIAMLMLTISLFAWFFYTAVKHDHSTFSLLYWLALISFSLMAMAMLVSMLDGDPLSELPDLLIQAMTLAAAWKCKSATEGMKTTSA